MKEFKNLFRNVLTNHPERTEFGIDIGFSINYDTKLVKIKCNYIGTGINSKRIVV